MIPAVSLHRIRAGGVTIAYEPPDSFLEALLAAMTEPIATPAVASSRTGGFQIDAETWGRWQDEWRRAGGICDSALP